MVHHSGGAVAELILFLLDFGDSEFKSAVSCLFFTAGGGFEFRPLPFHCILLFHQVLWEIRNVRVCGPIPVTFLQKP